mmetsp:Transcript_49244/g.141559  ORF Transcript_49244/g.141559 Transcript_49244/m.141559 type:complete len:205 (-) Transcript_49244:2177-2791(-)
MLGDGLDIDSLDRRANTHSSAAASGDLRLGRQRNLHELLQCLDRLLLVLLHQWRHNLHDGILHRLRRARVEQALQESWQYLRHLGMLGAQVLGQGAQKHRHAQALGLASRRAGATVFEVLYSAEQDIGELLPMLLDQGSARSQQHVPELNSLRRTAVCEDQGLAQEEAECLDDKLLPMQAACKDTVQTSRDANPRVGVSKKPLG